MRTVYRDSARLQRGIGGAITSLVTPFRNDGIDCDALAAEVEWQIRNGIDGLSVCGLAGEGPTLTQAERLTVISLCIEAADGRVPVIAATGTHCTETTIEATRLAKLAGADAALVTVPYYSKPTQNGILAHFASLATATDLPIVVDNRPAHTGIDLTPDTVGRIGRISTVIGLVDGGSGRSLADAWVRLLPARVGLYTSQDAAATAFTLSGGSGLFSDVANVAPRLTAALLHAAAAGNLAAAASLQDRLRPLWQALALDGTAAAIKHALCLQDRPVAATVRLPLVDVDATTEAALSGALEGLVAEREGMTHFCPALSQSRCL